MGSKAKWTLGLGICSLLVLVISRIILSGWHDYMWAPLGLFLVSTVMFFIFEARLVLEVLSMRTTKHGMNMGVLLLMALVLVGAINYLSVLKDKTFDLTEERINSLAPQSEKVVKALKGPVQALVFYLEVEGFENMKSLLKQNIELYKAANGEISLEFINSYEDVVRADQYLKGLSDLNQNSIFVFLEHQGRKVRVKAPFQEQQITSALIQVTRDSKKKIVFLEGHGEKSLSTREPEGLSSLKEAMENSGFETQALNLTEGATLDPATSEVVVIPGPQTQYLEGELEQLRDYARKGGRLLISIDPGMRHNLALLTKSFGIEFSNNFVIGELNQAYGASMAAALGQDFSKEHPATQGIPEKQMSLFNLASALRADSSSGFQTSEIVKTSDRTFTISELKQDQLKAAFEGAQRRPESLVLFSKGKLKANKRVSEEQLKEFEVIVVGDSDFLSNKSLFQGVNQDLALNLISSLAKQEDLLSIRPRQLKGTSLMLSESMAIFTVIGAFAVPLIFGILGVVFWLKRRGA